MVNKIKYASENPDAYGEMSEWLKVLAWKAGVL